MTSYLFSSSTFAIVLKRLLFFLCALGVSSLQAQVYDNIDDENDAYLQEDKTPLFNDWRGRLHTGVSSSYFIDFISSPLGEVDVVYTDPGNIKRIEKGATQTSYSSYFTIGFVPRYNLVELNSNLAIAASLPVAIGFGNASASSTSVIGGTGFGNLQIPLMFHFFYGAESTFRSQEKVGFNIGCGYEFNKIGLIDFSINRSEPINKAWLMPAITGGVQFYRGLSPVEVNVKYGFGKVQDQWVDQYGNKLTDGKRITRAYSLKLCFIYYL